MEEKTGVGDILILTEQRLPRIDVWSSGKKNTTTKTNEVRLRIPDSSLTFFCLNSARHGAGKREEDVRQANTHQMLKITPFK